MKTKQVITILSFFTALFLLLFYITAERNKRAMSLAVGASAVDSVFVIDAGHGGADGGAVAYDGTLEKTINLAIAEKLESIIKISGYKTVMTRTTDDSIHDPSAKTLRQQKVSDIHNRLDIVEKTNNSVLISIHQNHYSVPKYSGAQVFYSKNNTESEGLADSIQKSIVRHLQNDNTRQIKPIGTDIYLLYHTTRPAVMVECGFLSNNAEAEDLKDDGYRTQMAAAVFCGITDYFSDSEDV
ncbi:MAG: N-acetylmuramoyl-L-alanine amidase [Clostridiales bacterium]|nr:N-acetylmuramoyl-L-alanine amidase [Clostridiales bacterium]